MTNKEFNEYWNDIDNRKVIQQASLKYKKFFDSEELKSHQMMALWKALKSYKNDSRPFHSFLYQSTKWELIKAINETLKFSYRNCQIEDVESSENFTTKFEIADLLNKIPKKYSKPIIQKFFHNMTLEEIGKSNGYSYETARCRINSGLKLLKKFF